MQPTPKAEGNEYGISQNSEWNEGIGDQNMTWADESSVPAPTTIFAANVPAAAPAPAVPVDDWNAPPAVAPVTVRFILYVILFFFSLRSKLDISLF